MWGQLGWFTALMCLGSVAGAIAWFAIMQSNAFAYEALAPGVAVEQRYTQLASSDRWFAVFHIHYPVEFLFLVIPKLMILHRLISKNASQGEDLDGHVNACDCIRVNALEKLYRATAAIVVVCGVGGMAAMFVSASFRLQLAGVHDEAAEACGAQENNTDSCNALRQVAITVGNNAGTSGSIQNVLEAVALVVVSVAYAVLIPVSVAMFGRANSRSTREMATRGVGVASASLDHLPPVDDKDCTEMNRGTQAAHDGDKDRTEMMLHAHANAQRRRVVAACCMVFITFIVRASFDLLQAYAAFNDPYNPECGICDPCQTDAYLIRKWISCTPHFQAIVVPLSSPLPLMISLWLMMTTEERLQLLFPGANNMTYSRTLHPDQKKFINARLGRSPLN